MSSPSSPAQQQYSGLEGRDRPEPILYLPSTASRFDGAIQRYLTSLGTDGRAFALVLAHSGHDVASVSKAVNGDVLLALADGVSNSVSPADTATRAVLVGSEAMSETGDVCKSMKRLEGDTLLGKRLHYPDGGSRDFDEQVDFLRTGRPARSWVMNRKASDQPLGLSTINLGIYRPEQNHFFYGLAGDSRLWMIREGECTKILGANPKSFVGHGVSACSATFGELSLRPGDLVFFASDGLNDNEVRLVAEKVVFNRQLPANVPRPPEPEAFLQTLIGALGHVRRGVDDDVSVAGFFHQRGSEVSPVSVTPPPPASSTGGVPWFARRR